MSGIAAAALSIAMIAAALLGGVGFKQILKKDDKIARQRGLMMVAMAIILIGNVLIWTI
ncbi:hypothetical protein [Sphingomicrobium clamense]|uniref:HIG1 domain-containing protein n=1 Tax=Sphingomicrobium clamense TaxID=2851013 RepID=A0ABS6V6F0_9SPHN|nr:hypothetical protein [Sphingomicrobium sp. B8]MBW0145146.1 hypothetical protein [Sphingomicrobium sp. B8]